MRYEKPWPVPTAVAGADRIIVAESAYNQLGRIVKDALYGHCQVPITEYYRPSISILTEEIVDLLKA